ncbi:MAG: DUF3592 domain-containing protein [Chloroflexi bacterium]|nr:MAG: DUF3592 domain-containing protein [Chloroflexota bacterium]
MRSQLPHAIIAPVFLTLGVLAVAWAVLAFRSQRRFLSKAMRATGVVKSLTAERLEKTTFYFPVITFTTAAGVPVTAQSKTSISSSYPIGKTISVLYDPNDPNSLEIDAWSRWVVVAAATFLAIVFVGIGTAALISSS